MESKMREMAASQVRPPGGGSTGSQYGDWVGMEGRKEGWVLDLLNLNTLRTSV